MGAVVLKDVAESSVMVGNPAKLLRKESSDA
jgi:acetyltransferase-like isoleucine patch superfamily enzyme